MKHIKKPFVSLWFRQVGVFLQSSTSGSNKSRFCTLKKGLNRSFWSQIRVQKSIRILDRKKKVQSREKWTQQCRETDASVTFWIPGDPWEGQFQKKRQPNTSRLVFSQRRWAKARRIISIRTLNQNVIMATWPLVYYMVLRCWMILWSISASVTLT